MIKSHFKSKVLKIFLVIALLPLLLAAGSNLYLVIKTRGQNIVELQNLAMDNLSEKIMKYLNEKTEGLNLVVSGDYRSINGLPINNLYFLLSNSFNHSKVNTLDFIDENGYIVAKMDKNGVASYGRAYLDQYNEDNVPLVDESGAPILKSALRSLSPVEADVSQSPDYQAASKGEYFYGQLEKTPVMRLATQIRNKDKEIIGIVSAEVDLKQIDLLSDQISLGSRGYLYIMEKSGTAVASGNKQIVRIGNRLSGISYISDYTSGKNSNSRIIKNLQGDYAVFAGKAMPEVDWFIFSEWPLGDAYSVIGNILRWSGGIFLAILALVIALGIYFARQITRPIRVLSDGSKEISSGNLDHQIDLKTNDEFEVLGGQFNEMIKVLKENQKLRDEFVFIAAHELRTPVTAIRGYLSMVLEGTFGPVPQKINDNLLIVNRSNDRLVQLVQDLLEVARSEAGKMKIEMKAVDINKQISGVGSELKSLADQKKISINYAPTAGFTVMADEYKLNEVLVNIIGNAIKYTVTDGAINISHEQKDGMLITHIRDHGIGMTKEQMEKLFTKFYRIQTDVTQKIEGTGLGLFICKEIVERMNGRIWVESEEGKGSVFSFSLAISK